MNFRLANLKTYGGFIAAAIPVATGGYAVYSIYIQPIFRADLSGRWCVEHKVESADHAPYVGMQLMFHFDLRQDNNEIKGTGRKVLVNGERPRPLEMSLLEIKSGYIRSDRVTLSFIERSDANPNRTVNGTIDWQIKDKATLQGKFDTSAGNAGGSSVARKC